VAASRWVGALSALLLLNACATYRPLPLPETADLAGGLSQIKVDSGRFPLPRLAAHPFDTSDGLDWVEVAMLAVANNPALKASRLDRGEAAAQVFAAGLLPDPGLSATLSRPTNGVGNVNGFDLGLDYDLKALLTRNAGRRVEEAARQQVDLQLLWQEWQVIQKARQLTLAVGVSRRKLALLEAAQTAAERQYERSRRLLRQGDLTLAVAAAEASTWFDLNSRLQRQRREESKQRHALQALLGLSPEVTLPLAPLPTVSPGRSMVRPGDWSSLPQHRPDLLALQAGYHSQEQRVRQAILAKFPALQIGFTRARDTDGLYTSGLGITLELPLFSGGRGEIRVARATRARLRGEYQARLDQTRSDVARLLDRQDLLQAQYSDLQRQLPALGSLVATARAAHARGDLPTLDLRNLETTLLQRRLEAIDLQQALWRVRIALDTLLAWPETKE